MLTGRFRYPSDGNTPVGLQPLPSITEVASSIGYAQYLPSYREVQAGEGLLTSTDSPRPQFLACHHLPQVTGQHPSPPVKAEIVHPHYVSPWGPVSSNGVLVQRPTLPPPAPTSRSVFRPHRPGRPLPADTPLPSCTISLGDRIPVSGHHDPPCQPVHIDDTGYSNLASSDPSVEGAWNYQDALSRVRAAT